MCTTVHKNATTLNIYSNDTTSLVTTPFLPERRGHEAMILHVSLHYDTMPCIYFSAHIIIHINLKCLLWVIHKGFRRHVGQGTGSFGHGLHKLLNGQVQNLCHAEV